MNEANSAKPNRIEARLVITIGLRPQRLEVDERVPDPQLGPAEHREQHHRGDQQDGDPRVVPAPGGALRERQHQADQAGGEQDRADQVDATAAAGRGLRDDREDADEGDQSRARR